MAAFFDDLTGFYGDGSVNQKGQSLEAFLEAYDGRAYDSPSHTADLVIFSHHGPLDPTLSGLQLLLVKRGDHPCIGSYALPGGFANMHEDLEETARRELQEETGVTGLPLEPIGTFGDCHRDPRWRVITTAYVSLVDAADLSVRAGDDAADAIWCDVSLSCETTRETEEETEQINQLTITNERCQLDTCVTVAHTRKHTGLIREESYTVLDRGKTAFDHGAIIVQAMHLLADRL